MEFVKLTDICDFQGGTQPPKSEWKKEYTSGYIRMLQIRDFTQPEKNNVEYVNSKRNLKTCIEEDILIGRYGASIGKICTGLEGAYNVALMKTIPNKTKILRDYLLYILKSVNFQNFILNIGTRAAQAGFNKEDLSKFYFFLPPLETQKKIAAILDEADKLRQLNKQLIKKYEALTQSLFLDMFGDPVANPKGWEKIELGSLSKISSGSTPSRKIEKYYEGNIPWVKTGEVNSTIIFETQENITQEAVDNSSCKIYPSGSLIIAMYGQGKTRGQIGMLGIDATTNQACAVIPPSVNMNFDFLFKLLQMSYSDLRSLGRGGNQPNLNSGLIKKYKVVEPPVKLQNQFAEHVKEIEQQKEKAQQALQKSEELFNSLLQKAFKGELVT